MTEKIQIRFSNILFRSPHCVLTCNLNFMILIQDCFDDEVQDAATSRGLQRRHLVHQAVRKDAHQMRQVLNDEQFDTYMMLLGVTLRNKGL